MNQRAFAIVVTVILTSTGYAVAADWPTRPDHDVTPGKVRSDLSLTEICNTTWGTDARFVTKAMKQSVMDAYHFKATDCPITSYRGTRVHRVEIDHLVPRSLGGADDTDNLWPECYEKVNADKSLQDDGAHKKDRLETELHKRICADPNSETLKTYQQKFESDWLSLYHEIYGEGG